MRPVTRIRQFQVALVACMVAACFSIVAGFTPHSTSVVLRSCHIHEKPVFRAERVKLKSNALEFPLQPVVAQASRPCRVFSSISSRVMKLVEVAFRAFVAFVALLASLAWPARVSQSTAGHQNGHYNERDAAASSETWGEGEGPSMVVEQSEQLRFATALDTPVQGAQEEKLPMLSPQADILESVAYFPGVIAKWALLPTSDSIPSANFIDAMDAVVPLFDRLGAGFLLVKSDVAGNVEKVRRAWHKHEASTVGELLRAEKALGHHRNKESASVAVLWLQRTVRFISELLAEVDNGLDASNAALQAYARTLQRYHGFVEKSAFQMALSAAPSTSAVLSNLGPDRVEVLADLRVFVRLSSENLARIEGLLEAEGID